ncbi:putative ribonuclease H-like domain-containing protein [Tanacetum coccineum]|uniref:Ribonuclease H-like domain-containing protein n=1 Tax=Tanacetum coccineum TaxID=301880 RepID=A0ABQ5J2F6_9ASTR
MEVTTTRYDKSKVECFNCHKMGHFARECKGHRTKIAETGSSSSRKTVNVEETSSKAMVAIDGAATYKRGLASVEEQLVFYYKKNEESPECHTLLIGLISDDKIEKKTVFPTVANMEFVRPKQQEKLVRKPVKYAKMYRERYPRPTVNCAWPASNVFNKAHSHVRRHFNKFTTNKNSNFNEKVNIVLGNVTTVGTKAVANDNKGNEANAVKASEKGVIDSGYSRHMTGNKSYLSDYEEIDGGFVAFGGNPKRGKISGKVLLRVPRKNNMYNVDLKNVVPLGGLTCLFAKATLDESNLWHKRLGHINFKTMNKLVRGNLVRGLPLNFFENNHTCVACQNGKQHKASCKTKTVSLIIQPLQMLHMDLFGPTFVKSIMKKMYCLVVTNDFGRFSWVFFLATKDETSGILKAFITGIENQINHRVKIIRCDNGTEFKNKEMNQLCEIKGIKREFSVARTPQQNGVAERKNRTLIEAARTMLADSKLPTTFWAEAVNTACYVQNRVLVIKPHNKTPYELFHGRTPSLSFMRPFGCPVTILNTLDHLGKFDGKADEGFFVGYSMNSKAFRVFNSRTRIVEETLYITFLENKPNVVGSGPTWLFDIDTLTKSMNYKPVVAWNQTNGNAGTKESIDAGQARKKTVPSHEYILLPLWTPDSPISLSSKRSDDEVADDAGKKSTKDLANEGDKDDQDLRNEFEREFERLFVQEKEAEININSTNSIFVISSPINTAGTKDVDDEPMMPNLEDTGIFGGAYDDEDFIAGGDMNNLESSMPVCPIVTTRVHKDHPKVWTLVDLPYGKRAIGTKWVYKNKKDERGIAVRNKARLVAQGYTQEEGIDYDEVFAPVVWIEAIRLFLAYASFKDFVVYQMDVKSAFLYGKIEEEVYVCQPPGFEDPEFPNRVYKVEKALYGLHQAPRAWIASEAKIRWDFFSQDKYVDEILKKVGFSTMRIASTPVETSKLLLKDAEAEDIDVHFYRSMIGSLMYLTAFRPDIMFVVCVMDPKSDAGLWIQFHEYQDFH